MRKEDFEQKISEIGSLEDTAQIRTLLGELKNDVCGVFDEFEQTTQERDGFKSDNESLRQANMKLFLQVGGKSEPDKISTPPEPEKPKRTFENLFNEKGELK